MQNLDFLFAYKSFFSLNVLNTLTFFLLPIIVIKMYLGVVLKEFNLALFGAPTLVCQSLSSDYGSSLLLYLLLIILSIHTLPPCEISII